MGCRRSAWIGGKPSLRLLTTWFSQTEAAPRQTDMAPLKTGQPTKCLARNLRERVCTAGQHQYIVRSGTPSRSVAPVPIHRVLQRWEAEGVREPRCFALTAKRLGHLALIGLRIGLHRLSKPRSMSGQDF